jgi:hypothetical protein
VESIAGGEDTTVVGSDRLCTRAESKGTFLQALSMLVALALMQRAGVWSLMTDRWPRRA